MRNKIQLSKLSFNILFLIYVTIWLFNQFFYFEFFYLAWGLTYWIFAFIGGITGLLIVKKWGGPKSDIGKTIYAFSIGLILQAIGQNFTNYYVLNEMSIYPSWADLGFFGSIPFYIYGSIALAKVAGIELFFQNKRSKVKIVLISSAFLLVTYYFLIRQIEYSLSEPLLFILDFGYPLGQSIFIMITLCIFFLTRNSLGSIFKKTIFLFLLALVIQYLADFMFSLLYANDLWIAGGFNDFLYLTAYFLMSSAIISLQKQI